MRTFLKWTGLVVTMFALVALLPHGVATQPHDLTITALPLIGLTLFDWTNTETLLTNAALTVRAQAVSLIDQGLINSPAFFPPVEARSVKLADIITSDTRLVADRREWNAPGRQITLHTPGFREVEMLPVETFFHIDEQEMQHIMEGANGNEAIFREIVGPDIPKRVDGLVLANTRRVDVDAFRAWALGTITVRNPQGTAADKIVDFQFDAARYVTPTPWTATPSTGTAWTGFMTELGNAQVLIGATKGAVMRLSTYRALQVTAPLRAGEAYPLSRMDLQNIVERETGLPFVIITFEDTVSIFNDGGLTTTPTAIWPANRVAFIPASGIIGATHSAPVATAYSLAQANPGMAIDVRGMTVVKTIGNEGKSFTARCQVNRLAVPNEQALYVVDAGV